MLARARFYSGIGLNRWRQGCTWRGFAADVQSEETREASSAILDTAAKESPAPDIKKEAASQEDSKASFGPFPPYCHPRIIPPLGNWRRFRKYIANPDRYKDITFFRNDNVMVVYHMFPKARVHLVALSRKWEFENLSELKKIHLPSIEEMTLVAESIISSLSADEELGKSGFQYGFHAIASVQQLPLHIVSRDFHSKTIIHRKRWQAFNTKFFIPARNVVSMLKKDGELTLEPEKMYVKMLRRPMYCHRCRKELTNIPRVNIHVRECEAEPQDVF